MVDSDLKVWLIEVNSSPSMDCKKDSVLSGLVKSVLHDLAKIVIDYKKNKSADKGGFVIAHKAKYEILRPQNNM
jgi:hypothetical protein